MTEASRHAKSTMRDGGGCSDEGGVCKRSFVGTLLWNLLGPNCEAVSGEICGAYTALSRFADQLRTSGIPVSFERSFASSTFTDWVSGRHGQIY